MKDATLIKRRTQQARLREARSFHISAATATSDLVQKPIRPLTGVAYNRMLREWDLFAAESEHNVSPLDVATLKRFLKWYCDGSKGRLTSQMSGDDADRRITQNSAYSCWKSFMSAWHRRSGDTFSKGIQNTIETLIYGGDDNWLNLCTARRPTRNFTVTDFEACVRQLWQNDWYDFRCEAYRIGLHQMMLMHIGTSARSGEYVMNLRYRDTLLYQVWFDDRPQPQLVIDLCRNHTKGLANLPRQQPEHLLYELVDLPFYYNTVAFFVAGLLAVQGLRDFDSWSSICAAKKPSECNFLCVTYTDDVLDRHVYSRYSATADDQTKAATSLVEALARLGQRTGFRDRPTPGAIRREALLQVDRHGYSINERMRHADHRNPNTYGGYYQNAISTVDGQATYFGLKQQLPVLHELFRGFSIRSDHQYRPEMPLRLQNQISDMQPASEDDDSVVDRRARQKLYDDRRRRRDSLRRTDQRCSGQTITRSDGCTYESDFQQARRLMPQRDRLAGSLFQAGSLRSAEGIGLINDLVALFSSRNSDTYCVELNSSRTHCDTCGGARPKNASQEWWRHVYQCRKERLKCRGGFTDFCFLCFGWFDHVDAWTEHASQHRQNLPLKCSLAMFRGTLIRPAWCPDCMSQLEKPGGGDKGLIQFLNVTAWKDHMDKHVHELRSGRHQCAHPRCAHLEPYESIAEYVRHRFDVHLIPVPDGFADNTSRRANKPSQDPAAQEGSRDASRLQSGRKPCFQSCEVSPDKSTRTVTRPSPRGLSARPEDTSAVFAEGCEDGGGHDHDDAASPALNMEFRTDHDQDGQYMRGESSDVSSSVSASSSSSSGRLTSPSYTTQRRQQSQSAVRSNQPANAKSKLPTIEVIIPSRPPQGWDDVPLVDWIGSNGEPPEEGTACVKLASDDFLVEAEAGLSIQLPPRKSWYLKRSTCLEKPHIDTANGTQKGASKIAEGSENFSRRRNAITEMHARIRDRRRSRFKVAATA